MTIKNYIGYITLFILSIIIGIISAILLPICEYIGTRVALIICSLIFGLIGINGLIWVGCSIHDDEQAEKKIRIKVIKHNNCFLLIDTITWRCVRQFDNLLDAQIYANELNKI